MKVILRTDSHVGFTLQGNKTTEDPRTDSRLISQLETYYHNEIVPDNVLEAPFRSFAEKVSIVEISDGSTDLKFTTLKNPWAECVSYCFDGRKYVLIAE